jgi:hypothetical protein
MDSDDLVRHEERNRQNLLERFAERKEDQYSDFVRDEFVNLYGFPAEEDALEEYESIHHDNLIDQFAEENYDAYWRFIEADLIDMLEVQADLRYDAWKEEGGKL